MRIVTVQFNYKGGPDYLKLLKVFEKSVQTHMPEVAFDKIMIEAPTPVPGKEYNFKYNTIKLRHWVDYLRGATDNIIFADCDMMAIQSAEHAFDVPFDIAFTARTHTTRIPMNGGILMARPTSGSISFFEEMLKANDRMFYDDLKFHNEWRRKYAGMNQAAFGYTYEKGSHRAIVHRYLTRQWNAVDCDWSSIQDDTVFIHYKSKLRKLILAKKIPCDGYKVPMQKWYEMAGVTPI